MAVVQPLGVSGEVARQLAQGRVSRQFRGLRQGRSDVVAEPGPAVGQQQFAALLQPGRRGGRPIAEERFARVGDMFGGVKNVENLGAIAELACRRVPDPLGAVTQNADRGSVGDPSPLNMSDIM